MTFDIFALLVIFGNVTKKVLEVIEDISEHLIPPLRE